MTPRIVTTALASLVCLSAVSMAAAQDHAACDTYAKERAELLTTAKDDVMGPFLNSGETIVEGELETGDAPDTDALIDTSSVDPDASPEQQYEDAYNFAYYTCMTKQKQTSAPAARATATGLEPWTSEWVQYCASKFKSFDPQTGYYMTYAGTKRFCW